MAETLFATGPAAGEAVVLLGRGRLGRTLTEALGVQGIPARNLGGRDAEAAALAGATLVILAVPDGVIADVAQALTAPGAQPPAGVAVVHLSGALGLDVLRPLADAGHPVGSFHPFQPFPAQRPPSAFHGATVGVAAADAPLRARLEALAVALGARPHDVPDADRAVYHAAAVMASTYVVTLAAQSQSLLRSLGWQEDDALDATLTLLRAALENLERDGVPEALSGPLRRGDVATVTRHLDAFARLAPAEDPSASYRALGIASTRLAVQTGLDPAIAESIIGLLSSHNDADRLLRPAGRP
jgi:predicted short-subunit dehydrogenase-like oxidoreductase (DUF2520 family)